MKDINVNSIKTSVLAGYRYCQKVYDAGLESESQFRVFKNLCQNHVNYCNHWCNKLKPKLGYIQYSKMCRYNEFYELCELTVIALRDILAGFQEMLNKQAEKEEALTMLEEKVRLEHAVMSDIRSMLNQSATSRPIGFGSNGYYNKNNE